MKIQQLAKENQDKIALHTAIEENNETKLLELLNQNPNLINIRFTGNVNLLHVAANKNFLETAKLLLQKNPQLLLQTNDNGETSIDIAILKAKKSDQFDMVNELAGNLPPGLTSVV